MTSLFASPKKRVFILLMFKGLVLLSVMNHAIRMKETNGAFGMIWWEAVALLAANDYVRGRWLLSQDHPRGFDISVTISIALLGWLNLMTPYSGILAYIQLILIELLIFSARVSYILAGLHLISYVLPSLLQHPAANDPGNQIVNFAGFLTVGLLFRTIIHEKTKTENLYKELQEANATLQIYSSAVEELTIAKERARIAQELHDSIGHALVALSMNLEYAHQAIDSKPDKTKEVLVTALSLSRDGMAQLRKAVHTLNHTLAAEHLRRSLTGLFSKLEQTQQLTFRLEMDDEIEEENPHVKECLFKTVREAITNGIRHGGATLFAIRICYQESGVRMQIHNNGLESGPLAKSNGLLGMERRIAALGGQLQLSSDKGFTIDVRVPPQPEQAWGSSGQHA